HARIDAQPYASGGRIGGRHGETYCPFHDALKDRRRGGVRRHDGMRQARVTLPLTEIRDLRGEQQPHAGQEAERPGQLVVVVEVPAGAERVVQRYLQAVFVPVGEVRDACVGDAPRRGCAVDGALYARCERVAHRLRVGRAAAVDLDVVEHQLTEYAHPGTVLEVDPDERIHVAAVVPLLQDAEGECVQVPRLERPVAAREDGALPQRDAPPAGDEEQAVLHHEAMHHAADRVAIVQLCRDGLEVQAGTSDRHGE